MNSQHKHDVQNVVLGKVMKRTNKFEDYFVCDIEIISENDTERITLFSKNKNFMKQN